ncbi:hypothetical protein AOQ84DRAFT_280578 [Glonium stellatum]|uniref:Fatty acid desaturase domain-containing protein n=1 Tax=Glonium stellatum TaxID=574774 RepID=A0A8E2JYZ6_9PEZI|nr:hypothetical protein AOQ84DRAFT_280578 [Glonium stellatum]
MAAKANLSETVPDQSAPLDDFEIPGYTFDQFRKAIPRHCFDKSAIRGSVYVLRSLFGFLFLHYVFHRLVTPSMVPSALVSGLLWQLYGFMQGFFMTSWWVLAHECGHGNFSRSRSLSDFVGFIIHSILLVPYFSWQISHAAHHRATSHMERDQNYVPPRRDEYAKKLGVDKEELEHLAAEAPALTALVLVVRQLAALPVYLWTNSTSGDYWRRKKDTERGRKAWFRGLNHFDPRSPLFEGKDKWKIIASDLGVMLMALVLVMMARKYGARSVAFEYFVPWLWSNHWQITIAYLNHTDPSIPHYESSEWTYVRGAATTMDRNAGIIGHYLFHDITHTHVLHHHLSSIPWYHAAEATEAVKGVMGKSYRRTEYVGLGDFIRDMWRVRRVCQWVEGRVNHGELDGIKSEGVLWYRRRAGLLDE